MRKKRKTATAYELEKLRVEVGTLDEVYNTKICVNTKLSAMRNVSQLIRTKPGTG
jgi:hypothetical protein